MTVIEPEIVKNCPRCGDPMTRCPEGHPHGYDLFNALAPVGNVRGTRDPHWYCGNGEHFVIEVFDDGEVQEL